MKLFTQGSSNLYKESIQERAILATSVGDFQNFVLHIQVMHPHLYKRVLMLSYNWTISVQDKKNGLNVTTLLQDSLER